MFGILGGPDELFDDEVGSSGRIVDLGKSAFYFIYGIFYYYFIYYYYAILLTCLFCH